MKKELLTYKDPKSPVSEVFRTLRTNIQFMNTNRKLKTLLVTSTFPGEGKSWTTSNIAVTFAQAGKRVILIDADMRKGRQYNIFSVLPKPGLSNYLSSMGVDDMETSDTNIANYIQETGVENLHVLVAGNVPPNPSELLVSTRMRTLLDELKEMCDLVIIDGTPCDLVTDSIILSRFVDSTIIVAAQKETKKDNLARIVKNIQNVGGRIAGVVVNKVDISSKKYNQSYYYGSISANNINKHSKDKKKSDEMIASLFKIEPEDNDVENTSYDNDNNYDKEIEEKKNENTDIISEKFYSQDEEIEQNDGNETENSFTQLDSDFEIKDNYGVNSSLETEKILEKANRFIQENKINYDTNAIDESSENSEQNNIIQEKDEQPKNENIHKENYDNIYNNSNMEKSYNKKQYNKKQYNKNRNKYQPKNSHEKNTHEQHKNDKKDGEDIKLTNIVGVAESAKNITQDKASEIMNLVNRYIETEKEKQERKY